MKHPEGNAKMLDAGILNTVRWGSPKKPDHEEIWGIIGAKAQRLVLTTHRLIVAKGSVLEASRIVQILKEPGQAKVIAELTPETILAADKRNFAVPWNEVAKAEVQYYSNPFIRDQGTLRVITVNNKKYAFIEFESRMLCALWHILNATIPDKVSGPKSRGKFDREILKLKNTPVDVWCAYLRSLGFEAEIHGLEEKDKRLAAYLEKGVAEIKGRNIAFIVNQRVMLNWIVSCILTNIAGDWDHTRTEKRGKRDFEWVGDENISYALNGDASVRSALLEAMQAQEVDVVGITQPKDNSAAINLMTKEQLPSRRLLEGVDRIAGHLQKIK